MQEWRVFSKKADFKAIGERFGIDQIIARIIRNRDVEGDSDINLYLNGTLKDLYDASMLKDMDRAVALISESIDGGCKIRIIGDYDIDGICSIYILFKGLKRLGADVDYDVPDRISDGYGINENLIDTAHEAGAELILTCDNGIAAIEQIAYAKSLGMKVVVTDHHEVQYFDDEEGRHYRLPPADAVVDAKRPDCAYPFKLMCGAGIAYKLILKLYGHYGVNPIEAEKLLQFAAIATVGDIVDLVGENRIIVKEGLKRLRKTENYGLDALIALTGIKKAAIDAYHIGFVIGPCLNASGRLDTAKQALKMLLADGREEAEEYASTLVKLNEERKRLTDSAVQKALDMVERSGIKDDSVFVIYLPDCHESIAGIVAGRIREAYYRPTIILTSAKDGAKGSGRSVEEYNMFEKLSECADLFYRFGGHPMAAGLSLPEDKIDELRSRLNANCNLSEADLREKIWIDVPMPIGYINENVVKNLALLAPFGKGNQKPVFADKNLTIRWISAMGRNKEYTRMSLEKDDGSRIEAVGFFESGVLRKAHADGKRISCTYYPELNEFGGEKKLQICVTGYRIETEE
ncbi:MAG: single-stranded-DNA-specific exonuclease RecJ [Butyrivibrio sp.]|nr:single-stranded-DNA-specific exonuclease RecJ [Butyrivibrio sp.]